MTYITIVSFARIGLTRTKPSCTAKQRWNYIQHQTPDEIILIKCFDSFQGKDGVAKYAAHVATDILNEPEYEGEVKPRESVEVRLVVLHR
jgi:hypothetical protein